MKSSIPLLAAALALSAPALQEPAVRPYGWRELPKGISREERARRKAKKKAAAASRRAGQRKR